MSYSLWQTKVGVGRDYMYTEDEPDRAVLGQKTLQALIRHCPTPQQGMSQEEYKG